MVALPRTVKVRELTSWSGEQRPNSRGKPMANQISIAIGSDHAVFSLKGPITDLLNQKLARNTDPKG
jgi:hypothetical protein